MEKASRCDSILLLLTALCLGAVLEVQLLDFDLGERTPLVFTPGVIRNLRGLEKAREAFCPRQLVG